VRIDPRRLFGPLLAGLVLVAVLQQTLSSLQESGTWRLGSHAAATRAADPYSRLEGLLAHSTSTPPAEALRDPFVFGSAPRPVTPGDAQHRPVPRPIVPAGPQPPVLTSIIWDNDPRATILYDGRDFPVRESSLFADYRVKSITRTQVVLERKGEETVLTFRPKGDKE
jgi:hypothetical protein